MTRSNQFTEAVETFQNSSGLSRGEAKVFVARVIDGMGRQEASQFLGLEPSTIDTNLQRARDKNPRLPEISKIETRARVTPDDDLAVVIWFENGAKLQYRASEGTVYEETFHLGDSDSVHDQFDLAIDVDELHEAALESIAEYVNTYQNDIDAIRMDWPSVFEAITLYKA